MGRVFVIEPSGKFAVFSSIVDDYVYTDATKEELIEALAQEAYDREKERVTRELDLDPRSVEGKLHFMPYEEAEKIRVSVHGDDTEEDRDDQ